ncbi:MAG: bacterioferritin-associated ferredoxin [Gemmataceae bacterium]
MNGSPCDSCPNRIVCHCLQVTEDQLIKAISGGEIRSWRDLKEATGAGDGCTACLHELRRLIDSHEAIPS